MRYDIRHYSGNSSDSYSRNLGVHQQSGPCITVVKDGVVVDQDRFDRAIAAQHELAARIPGYEAITKLTPARRIRAAKDSKLTAIDERKARAAVFSAEYATEAA